MNKSFRLGPAVLGALALQAVCFSASAQRAGVDVGVQAHVGIDGDARRDTRRYEDRDDRRDDDRYYRRYDDADDRRDEDRRSNGGLIGNVVGGALGVAGTATRGALGMAGQATRGSLGLAQDVTTGVLGGGSRGRSGGDANADVDVETRRPRDRR